MDIKMTTRNDRRRGTIFKKPIYLLLLLCLSLIVFPVIDIFRLHRVLYTESEEMTEPVDMTLPINILHARREKNDVSLRTTIPKSPKSPRKDKEEQSIETEKKFQRDDNKGGGSLKQAVDKKKEKNTKETMQQGNKEHNAIELSIEEDEEDNTKETSLDGDNIEEMSMEEEDEGDYEGGDEEDYGEEDEGDYGEEDEGDYGEEDEGDYGEEEEGDYEEEEEGDYEGEEEGDYEEEEEGNFEEDGVHQNNEEDNSSKASFSSTLVLSSKNNTISEGSHSRSRSRSRFAYAFLLGGVDPKRKNHHGMLFTILIAARVLKNSGSKADIIVFCQMSAKTPRRKMSATEAKWLEALGVEVRYLPKPKVQNFHQIIMQKFVVLDLIEYERVLFLDSDVTPYCNLDYIFELSADPDPLLMENMVIALTGAPSNAGFFMLSPKPGDLDQLREIVAERERKGAEFDVREGWGHVIKRPDKWYTAHRRRKGRTWKFVGAHADQGLLYTWVKYVKQNVSIVTGEIVENWGSEETSDGTRKAVREEMLKEPFQLYTCLPKKYEDTYGEIPTYHVHGLPPYRDFAHFVGHHKPWKQRKAEEEVSDPHLSQNPAQFWFAHLRLLNKELNLGINFDNWSRYRRRFQQAPLGSLPKQHQMLKLMKNNQTLVQT